MEETRPAITLNSFDLRDIPLADIDAAAERRLNLVLTIPRMPEKVAQVTTLMPPLIDAVAEEVQRRLKLLESEKPIQALFSKAYKEWQGQVETNNEKIAEDWARALVLALDPLVGKAVVGKDHIFQDNGHFNREKYATRIKDLLTLGTLWSLAERVAELQYKKHTYSSSEETIREYLRNASMALLDMSRGEMWWGSFMQQCIGMGQIQYELLKSNQPIPISD